MRLPNFNRTVTNVLRLFLLIMVPLFIFSEHHVRAVAAVLAILVSYIPAVVKRNYNVGRAHINGFELQARKSLGWLDATVNYTYLDHRNETNDRPLDALSDHTLNFDLTVTPVRALSFSVFGLGASKSFWFDTTSNNVLTMPAYFNLDALASYHFFRFDVFLKVTNIFNNFWYSEPVFPARARFFEVGTKIRVF